MIESTEHAIPSTPEFNAMKSRGMTSNDLLSWMDTDESKRHGEYLARRSEELSTDYPDFENLCGPPTLPTIPSSPWPNEFAQVREATVAGDLATVRSILDDWGGDMDNFSIAHTPALENGHIAVAACLLEHGVAIQGTHFKDAMSCKAYAFLDLYLRHGYNINDSRYPFEPTPLAELADEDMTNWLLDRGADPNAESVMNGAKMGETPLSSSMSCTPFSTIKLLLDRGGPDSIKYGSLLWHAAERRLPDRVEVVQYLLALGAAADLRKLLYHDRPEPAMQADWVVGRHTPLHGAARSGDLDLVKLFIASGADPTMPDSKGRLAIDEARKQIKTKNNGVTSSNGNHEGVVKYLSSLSSPPDASTLASFKGSGRL
ncbi:MAG: hypothetical protein Q9169_007348 [Polycauliona sp. 2 TL-2023]